MKKKGLVLFPLIALFLTGCNPIQAVKDYFTLRPKEEPQNEEQQPLPEPEPEQEPQEPVEPQDPVEPKPIEPVPFTFDQFDYQLKPGVERSEIQGNPWINSNLEDQLKKIEKPSLKDDFYASLNYDAILNGDDGIFDKNDNAIKSAFDKIYDASSGVSNSGFFSKVKNYISDGNPKEIATYFANFDYENYVNSASLFSSSYTWFSLDKDENNKYYVKFNDGYYVGEPSFGLFELYTSELDPSIDLAIDAFSSVFDLSFTSSQRSAMISFDSVVTNEGLNKYYPDGESTFSKFSFNNANTKFLDNALLDYGLTDSDNIYINSAASAALTRINKTSEATIKNALILRLAYEFRMLSGLTNYKEISKYTSRLNFSPDRNVSGDPDDKVINTMMNLGFHHGLERVYLQLEGDPVRKAKTEEVIHQIIDGYKATAETYDWIDEETKEGLLDKLNYMTFNCCYSDKMKSYPAIDETGISSFNLLELYSRYQNWMFSLKLNHLYDDTGYWDYMPSYTNNAFYNPGDNSFTILNGVLGGVPFDGSTEQILGSIGVIIGHEISHSIDSMGALYDKNGEYKDWWSESSKEAFNDKVDSLREFYNQIGVTNTLKVMGNNVDGEATADMGGVHICLEIGKTIPNFNYKLFFETYTNLWLSEPYESSKIEERNKNEHPFEYLRVNAVLAQFEEFFQTYKIGYGDKMYIPEDQRVAIW